MELLRVSIRYLAAASLFIAAIQIYLTLNKLWIRKHERAVAESVSIIGETLGLLPLVILTVNFGLDGSWAGILDGIMWIMAGLVTILIGTGMWVEGQRGRSLLTLFHDALQLERGEVGTLAVSLFRPSGARAVLDILAQIALIDDHLDDRERAFIQSFAWEWGIPLSWDEIQGTRTGDRVDMVNLRESVARYLSTSPPPAQVTQLQDVVQALVHIDDELSPREELMVSELDGMFEEYVEGSTDAPTYGVAIVPQDPEQERAIRRMLPDLEKRELEGGFAFVMGPYHSERYAEVVGEQYRSLNVFTTVVRMSAQAVRA